MRGGRNALTATGILRELRDERARGAHLAVAGDDLERVGDEEEKVADVGEERGPRRGSTARARITAPSFNLRTEDGREELIKHARGQSLKEETRRRRIERSSPAEQGRPWTHMAAAAKGPGGENETLGLRGGPRCPFMELSSRGWPRGSTAMAAGLCEREVVAALERDDAWVAGRWGQKGKGGRTASPSQLGRAGKERRGLGRGEKEKGSSSSEGFSI